MADTRNLTVRISGDSSSYKKAMSDVTDSTDKASGKVGLFSNILSGATKVAAGIGLANLTSQMFDLGKSAITGAAEFEQSRVAFETMLGSADKARGLMEQISQFAKETPFELPEVVAGSKQLLAFGFAQEQIIPTMRKLGDIASGVGVPVGQLTNVFGQVRVAGKLMGQDLLQFTNAGVPLIEALSATMKKPQNAIKDLVSEGKIGFKEVNEAINYLTKDGSKFGGMMEKQSHTFSGVVSNLKDGFGQILRSAVGVSNAGDIVKGGLFDKVKNAAESMLPVVQNVANNIGPIMSVAFDKISKAIDVVVAAGKQAISMGKDMLLYLKPSFEALFNTLNEKVFPLLQRLWKEVLEPLTPIIGKVLTEAIKMTVDALNALFAIITPVINFMLDHKQLVIDLATAFGILALAMNFNSIASAFTNSMNAVMGSIGAVKGATTNLFSTLAAGGVMGSIAVGGALADIALVMQAIQTVKDALRDMNNARQAAISKANSDNAVVQSLRDSQKNGTPDQKARATKTLNELAASGAFNTGFAEGGYTGYGGTNEVAGVVHRGEYVIPKSGVDQATGLPKAAQAPSISLTVNLGMYAGMPVEKRQIALDLYKELVRAARAQGTQLPMIGAVSPQ